MACKTVQGTSSEKKAFLESFIIELHQNGYHPMMAGWDIPIDVIADAQSPDYGRKINSKPKGKLLGQERKTYKFVYVYRSSETTFKIPAAMRPAAGRGEGAPSRMERFQDVSSRRQNA